MSNEIIIVGESHFNKDAKDHGDENIDYLFTEQAKELAEQEKISLVLENEIIYEYRSKDTLSIILYPINTYPIEDKLIWEYTEVIMALCEIYPVIIPQKEPPNQCNHNYLQIEEMYRNNFEYLNGGDKQAYLRLKALIDVALKEYIECYILLRGNIQEENPVTSILSTLLGKLPEESIFIINKTHDMVNRDKALDNISNDDINFFKTNILFFNELFKQVAIAFSQAIRDGDYSEAIKNHIGISEHWINEYFLFKYVRPTDIKDLLDYDQAAISLRNQWFVEQLALHHQSEDSLKPIMFIVGRGHVEGLSELFHQQYPHINTTVWHREEKNSKLQKHLSNENILSSDETANPSQFFSTPPLQVTENETESQHINQPNV